MTPWEDLVNKKLYHASEKYKRKQQYQRLEMAAFRNHDAQMPVFPVLASLDSKPELEFLRDTRELQNEAWGESDWDWNERS